MSHRVLLPIGRTDHSSVIKVTAKKAPPVSPFYVPREREWRIMVDYLAKPASPQQKIFVITGMGGCGKTQMVSYFLQEYSDS